MRWVPRLGAFVDLVEFADVTNGGTALFKTVEAFCGAFFSTSVELKQRVQRGWGAVHEIIDSNMSLPSILTPRHF